MKRNEVAERPTHHTSPCFALLKKTEKLKSSLKLKRNLTGFKNLSGLAKTKKLK